MSRKCYKNKKKKKRRQIELKRGEKNKKKIYEQTSLCVYRVVVMFLLWHFGQEEEPFSQKN